MTKPAGVGVHAHFFPESFIRLVEQSGASLGAGIENYSQAAC
jgi:hypothetical protein